MTAPSSAADGPRVTSSIFSYLPSLPEASLNSIYDSPWCALAVLQSLDPLGQQVVLRLLPLRGTLIAVEFLQQWMQPTEAAQAALEASIARLTALRILGSPPPPPHPPRQ